jgi:hypothetical protein
MPRFTKKRGQQIQDEIQNRERKYRSRRIDEAIQRGYEHLYDGDLGKLSRLMRDILIPDLGLSRHNLRHHAEQVTGAAAELQWSHESVRRFTEDPERYVETVTSSGPQDAREQAGQLYLRAAGMSDPRERHRQTVVNAFHSLESLAVARGFVSNSVTNWAPARGYELQIGTWYQPPRDDMPFDIQLVDPGDSEEVTVNMGKPGRGKGVAGHTESEDRHAAGRKIVDLVDFDECEGGVLDIAMANPTLREVREDMGLPADFNEHPEYEPPNLEIMVPLTDGLGDRYIPYHGPNPEDTVVRAFTVPASSLSKRALKRFISAELTPTQVNIFESAYDEIQRSRDDWNLHDLIMAVERHRGLHGNQGAVDRVQRSIRRVQSKGWIRDRDDPHCINWERILTDTDTATVFTASLMQDTDEAAKYLFHSYVIYAFRTELKRLKELPDHERDGWDHVPKITGILRELHKIAPNSETAEDDPTIREIQEAMTSDFRDLTAMHRHEGVELICDTQNFIGEIKKRARKNFNRAFLFQVNLSDAYEMFQEVAGETRDKYPKRVTRSFGVGECAVLGRVGTGRPFEMTVSVAPPMSHHFDPDEWVHPERGITKGREDLKKEIGGDPEKLSPEGWKSVNSVWDLRVYLLDEQYRPARELLDATGATASEPEQTDLDSVRAADRRPDSGPGQFGWDALEIDPNGRVILDRLQIAYNNYAEANDFPTYEKRSSLCQLIGGSPTPEDDDRLWKDHWEHARPVIHEWDDGKAQTPVYKGVRFTDDGEKWAEGGPEPDDEDANPGRTGEEPTSTEDADGDDATGPSSGEDPEPEPELKPVQSSGGDDGPDLEPKPEDPALGDMDCCGAPEPIPMYAGDERDHQVGASGWREGDRRARGRRRLCGRLLAPRRPPRAGRR